MTTSNTLIQKGRHQNSGYLPPPGPSLTLSERQAAYLAYLMEDYSVGGKSVLEIGCGIGLASLVLNHRGANITATDYYPEEKAFLDENTHLNQDPNISFVRTSWDNHLANALGPFDFIIGSDLFYEHKHPGNLASLINRHAQEQSTVLIVDPRRGYFSKFMKRMTDFGFRYSVYEHKPFPGKIICFTR